MYYSTLCTASSPCAVYVFSVFETVPILVAWNCRAEQQSGEDLAPFPSVPIVFKYFKANGNRPVQRVQIRANMSASRIVLARTGRMVVALSRVDSQ